MLLPSAINSKQLHIGKLRFSSTATPDVFLFFCPFLLLCFSDHVSLLPAEFNKTEHWNPPVQPNLSVLERTNCAVLLPAELNEK